MNKKVKFLSSLLAILFLAGVISGCVVGKETVSNDSGTSGSQEKTGITDVKEPESGLPLVKEKVTFKVAVFKHSLDKSNNFNEKEIFKRAEQETNIHIEFIEVPAGTNNERVPIMLATDLPDAFINLLTETHVAKNKDQLVVLNDLLEKYAPNIKSQYDEIPDMWDMMRFPDGKIYTLATSLQVSRDDDGDAMLFMNQKWVEKVGKKIPTTIDEFYDVLKAFKTGDPNGNGKNDEIPLEICENNWAAGIMKYAGPWGITDVYYNIENGKVSSAVTTQAFRDFLEFYSKLAREGLLDIEGFSQTNQQFYAKLKEYICGAYSGWTPQSNFDSETAKEYVMVLPMEAPGYEGKQVKTGQWNRFRGNRTGFAITKACKDEVTLLRWWDYLHSSTELKFTYAYGKEGKIWERDASGQVWTIFPEVTADYTREHIKYTEGFYGGVPIILEREMEKNDGNKYPDSVLRYNMTVACKDYYKKEFMPIRFVAEEKINERALLETEINTYMKKFIAESIINGIDDAKWQAHIDQLKKLKFDEWIQWYQDFLDKKF